MYIFVFYYGNLWHAQNKKYNDAPCKLAPASVIIGSNSVPRYLYAYTPLPGNNLKQIPDIIYFIFKHFMVYY